MAGIITALISVWAVPVVLYLVLPLLVALTLLVIDLSAEWRIVPASSGR